MAADIFGEGEGALDPMALLAGAPPTRQWLASSLLLSLVCTQASSAVCLVALVQSQVQFSLAGSTTRHPCGPESHLAARHSPAFPVQHVQAWSERRHWAGRPLRC